MSMSDAIRNVRIKDAALKAVLMGIAVYLVIWSEVPLLNVLTFVTKSMINVSVLVIPGILLAAWVSASGAADHIARYFEGRMHRTIFMASLVGALTPVCGVTTLPLMAGMLAAGIPFAPIMAFWLSSPVTDPAMFATTVATLGMSFAVGKTATAFCLGILGGMAVVLVSKREWARDPLRKSAIVGRLGQVSCREPGEFAWQIWQSKDRRKRFVAEASATARLVVVCLVPAFAAEYILGSIMQPEVLSDYVGESAWWAVPVSVLVGAPMYLDGYAALPLTRSLIDHGMSHGAAMAFLVSGGVVSIWGAIAIFPVLRFKPFMLYLMLAASGSMSAGWVYGFLA